MSGFNLEKMGMDEFKNFLDGQIDKSTDQNKNPLKPYSISFESAKKEAMVMLDDFEDEKTSTVMHIFEYEEGYQVDIISNHPEFQIYEEFYGPKDIYAIVFWDEDEKILKRMK